MRIGTRKTTRRSDQARNKPGWSDPGVVARAGGGARDPVPDPDDVGDGMTGVGLLAAGATDADDVSTGGWIAPAEGSATSAIRMIRPAMPVRRCRLWGRAGGRAANDPGPQRNSVTPRRGPR